MNCSVNICSQTPQWPRSKEGMLSSKGDGWLLPQGELSGTHAGLFTTKGGSWGAQPQPAPALLHSICTGGCDPPTAHGCQPSQPAGPVPCRVWGSPQGLGVPAGSGGPCRVWGSPQGQRSGDAGIDPAGRDTPRDGAGWRQGEQEARNMGTESVTQALPCLSVMHCLGSGGVS